MASVYSCLHFECASLSIAFQCGRKVCHVELGKHNCFCAYIAHCPLDEKFIQNSGCRGIDGGCIKEFLLNREYLVRANEGNSLFLFFGSDGIRFENILLHLMQILHLGRILLCLVSLTSHLVRILPRLVQIPPPFGRLPPPFVRIPPPLVTPPFRADTASFGAFTSPFRAFTSSFRADTPSFGAFTPPFCSDTAPFGAFDSSFSADTPLPPHLVRDTPPLLKIKTA